MIRHDADQPYRIDPQDKPVFICACGLSKDLPFCDGAHKTCKSEADGTLYVYDEKRESVAETRPDA
ncbi:MAG: CDGSH iron-sulfur domain-containing protein [Planctomycetota bacterium]